jgi:class 3 adenylate cyclase
MLSDATVGTDGHVVEARADKFLAVLECPRSALDTAVTIQRQLRGRSWAEDLEVRVRIGIHSGYPTLTEANYIGMAVHTAGARLRSGIRQSDPGDRRNEGGNAGVKT